MKKTATEKQYRAAFDKEVGNKYPAMDEVEARLGYAIDKDWMDQVAYKLNCPIKVNPPNWQHGRLIYALVRSQMEKKFSDMDDIMVDIGTAKGFSACMIAKALSDSTEQLTIHTVDITDPKARIVRNTVLEINGLMSLPEMLNPLLPVGQRVSFYGNGAQHMLRNLVTYGKHVPFAFVDGKHAYLAVKEESELLSACQRGGDIILFDDCQIECVDKAVNELTGYAVSKIENGPRKYAIASKLG